MMIEAQERGWKTIGKNICRDCLSHHELAIHLKYHTVRKSCDYCGNRRKVVSMDDVLGLIASAIRSKYDHPENGLPWDGREEGWQLCVVYDSYDLLIDEFQLGESRAFRAPKRRQVLTLDKSLDLADYRRRHAGETPPYSPDFPFIAMMTGPDLSC